MQSRLSEVATTCIASFRLAALTEPKIEFSIFFPLLSVKLVLA